MVVKTTQGKSFKGLLEYCLQEFKDPVILDSNGTSRTDAKGLTNEFNAIVSENINISKPVFHISINFSDNEINPQKMSEIALKLIEKIGMTRENNQFVIIQHQDKQHIHCHLVMNRIGFDGKAISDYYIKSKVVKMAKELEIEYGFTKVQDLAIENATRKDKKHKDPEKNDIILLIESIFKNEKPKSLNEIAIKLKSNNIEMNILEHSNNGKAYGITFGKDGKIFKGSALGKQYSLNALENRLTPTKIEFRTLSRGLEIN